MLKTHLQQINNGISPMHFLQSNTLCTTGTKTDMPMQSAQRQNELTMSRMWLHLEHLERFKSTYAGMHRLSILSRAFHQSHWSDATPFPTTFSKQSSTRMSQLPINIFIKLTINIVIKILTEFLIKLLRKGEMGGPYSEEPHSINLVSFKRMLISE